MRKLTPEISRMENAGISTCVRDSAGALLVLAVLELAVLGIALSFVPSNGDDLIHLSNAARTDNPLRYFASDAGLGKNEYRPLLPLSMWIVHRLSGVSAFPNQLINLILHFTVGALLLIALRRQQIPQTGAVVVSAAFLVSIYTMSPAIWVSDRPTLLVAICFMLLVLACFGADPTRPRAPGATVAAVVSAMALFSKESGLLVPMAAAALALKGDGPFYSRVRTAVVCGLIVAAYLLLRLSLFGANAAAYDESGYFLGTKYESLAALPPADRLGAQIENVLKNLAAPFLPIFNGDGGFLSARSLATHSAVWISVVLVSGISLLRSPTLFQKFGLLVIVMNAGLHFSVFRYRIHYLSWLAVCLLVGGAWNAVRARRLRILRGAALYVAVLGSVAIVQNGVLDWWWWNFREMNGRGLGTIQKRHSQRLSPEVVNRVLARYRSSVRPL